MNTVRRKESRETLTAIVDRLPITGINRRHDNGANAGTACGKHQRIAIGDELGRIEMAVRIDQHA